jgi:DNA mismatch repair protein MutL
VISAFDGLLAPKKIPSYFLNLSVDPNSIDINIHPTKTEIKFDDEPTLYALLRAAVKHSLGQFNIAPVLDFERNSSFDTPYSSNINSFVTPKLKLILNLILLTKTNLIILAQLIQMIFILE